ncbi:MAG: hypothetical protein A4E28_01162 [Methanocella sp. PtaU1.Bin125]|nr:MAG: hypothetical protein A4E28_01162 [Methanocella sp. PtaU1.Bin125]
MSGDMDMGGTGRKLDFEAFPENLELARNIEQRIARIGMPEANGPAAIREMAGLQRYMTELYSDVEDSVAAMSDCVSIATAAYVLSRMLAPKYYESEGESGPVMFVKRMGDAMAMNEADIDLGTGRWTTTADLIIDMLSALSVFTGTLAVEADSEEGYIPHDLDYNVLTSCSLIAAYALIVYQCAKDGSYRGQVLQDMKH